MSSNYSGRQNSNNNKIQPETTKYIDYKYSIERERERRKERKKEREREGKKKREGEREGEKKPLIDDT